jgi:hypothetical protein
MATGKNYRVSNAPRFTQSDRANSIKLSSRVRLNVPKSDGNGKVEITARASGIQAEIMSAAERIRKENFDRPNFG